MVNSTAEPAISLSTAVCDLEGVGSRRARRYAALGIDKVINLIRHMPTRYEQESEESEIRQLPRQGIGSARGMLTTARWVPRVGRRQGRFEVILQDTSGTLKATWFNAQYLHGKLHPGMVIRVQGKITIYQSTQQMINPRWELLDDPQQVPLRHQRLRPIYPATEDLSSTTIEQLVANVLPKVQATIVDPLPANLVHDHAMPSLATAFGMLHAPKNADEPLIARRRLAFNELLLLQLGIALKHHYTRTCLMASALKWTEAIDEHIRDRFPFTLTKSQNQVVTEVATDLQKIKPMNRLLQGDVGAGKTVVALYALLLAVANRKQATLMAPTELLAEQHFASLNTMLEGAKVRMALLTSSQNTGGNEQRSAISNKIASGQIDIVVGTHALLSESVKFKDLAVVVIDEQHRFGVAQRATFRSRGKGEENGSNRRQSPHHLIMTATPIPRTLSLTVFGDLDISTIDELPPDRGVIETQVVDQDGADRVYQDMAKRLAIGEQAYVVVPAINDSEYETRAALKNVHTHARLLADKYCQDYKVSAIHGQLSRQTRELIMDQFRHGQIHVLVATTVIEVGVDVPNAGIMIVEHAERFGLAQLHQLRGRIGRGNTGRTSMCVFIAEPNSKESAQRMAAIAETNDGFKIAEVDLKIRGMGDFFGTRQHGLPPLRVARIPDDLELLQLARRDARMIIDEDPKLADPSRQLLRKILVQQFGDALGLIDVG